MKKKTIFKKICVVAMTACLTGVCCFGSNLHFLVGDEAYASEGGNLNTEATPTLEREKTEEADKAVETDRTVQAEKAEEAEKVEPTSQSEAEPQTQSDSLEEVSVYPYVEDEDFDAVKNLLGEEKYNKLMDEKANLYRITKGQVGRERQLYLYEDEQAEEGGKRIVEVVGEEDLLIDGPAFRDKALYLGKSNYRNDKVPTEFVFKTKCRLPENSHKLFSITEPAGENDVSYDFITLNFEKPMNTSNVKNMSNLFAGTHISNADFSEWDTENVINMYSIFSSAIIDMPVLDLSKWNVKKVQEASGAFSCTKAKKLVLHNWDFEELGKCENPKDALADFFSKAEIDDIDVEGLNLHGVDKMAIENMFYYTRLKEVDLTRFVKDFNPTEKAWTSIYFPNREDYSVIMNGKMIKNNNGDAILRALPHYVYKIDSDGEEVLVHGMDFKKSYDSLPDDKKGTMLDIDKEDAQIKELVAKGMDLEKAKGTIQKDEDRIKSINDIVTDKYDYEDGVKYRVSTIKPEPYVVNKTVGAEVKYEDLEEAIGKTAKIVSLASGKAEDGDSKKTIKSIDTSKAGDYPMTVLVSFNGDSPVPIDVTVRVKAPYTPSVKIPKSKGLTVEKGTKITAEMLADTFEDLDKDKKIESFSEINTDIPGDYVIKAKISGIYQDIDIPVKVLDKVEAVESKKPEAKAEAETKKNAVDTGDNNDLAALGLVVAGAAAGLAVAAKKREEN